MDARQEVFNPMVKVRESNVTVDEDIIDLVSDDEEPERLLINGERSANHINSISDAEILELLRESLQHNESHICHKCNESFRYKVGLISHEQSVHSGELNELNKVTKNKNKLKRSREKKKKLELRATGKLNDAQSASKMVIENTEPLAKDICEDKDKTEQINCISTNKEKNSSSTNKYKKVLTLDNLNIYFEEIKMDNNCRYRCTICDAFYDSRVICLKHYKRSHFVKYTCEFCNRTYAYETKFRAHVSHIHKMRQFWICSECSKIFPDKMSLRLHADTCSTDESGRSNSIDLA